MLSTYDVVDVQLLYDNTDRPSGTAHAYFRTYQDAEAARAFLKTVTIEGRTLNVSLTEISKSSVTLSALRDHVCVCICQISSIKQFIIYPCTKFDIHGSITFCCMIIRVYQSICT